MSTRIGDSGRDRQDDQDSENADGNADDYDVCVCVAYGFQLSSAPSVAKDC